MLRFVQPCPTFSCLKFAPAASLALTYLQWRVYTVVLPKALRRTG